jgi:hypothetical protein
MEAVISSEMSVTTYNTTQHQGPEEQNSVVTFSPMTNGSLFIVSCNAASGM